MPKSSAGIKARFPGFIELALATLIERSPKGARWIHENKIRRLSGSSSPGQCSLKVFTRRGNDWTTRFDKIASDAWHIAAGSAIIDGEVVEPHTQCSFRLRSLGTMLNESGSHLAFKEDLPMDPFTALRQAGNYVRLAEAADGTDRERHLRSAKQWLERADVDAWFQHKGFGRPRSVIIASDEKQTDL